MYAVAKEYRVAASTIRDIVSKASKDPDFFNKRIRKKEQKQIAEDAVKRTVMLMY